MELELHLSPRHSGRLVFSRARTAELLGNLADARAVLPGGVPGGRG